MVSECPVIADNARFTATETAKLLGISKPTLRDRVERGFITKRFYRDNGRPYFTGSDIKSLYRRIAL